jgi:hypothetical protein
MGGTQIRDWFQANANLMAEVHVAVRSQNEIRIDPEQ